MKIIRVKYIPPLGPMIQDLQRIFPELPITAAYIDSVNGILINRKKKRFVYVKEYRDELGARTKVIVYALVRDSFTVPLWIQGQELREIDLDTEPIGHYFMGHFTPVPDNPDEPPEEEIL